MLGLKLIPVRKKRALVGTVVITNLDIFRPSVSVFNESISLCGRRYSKQLPRAGEILRHFKSWFIVMLYGNVHLSQHWLRWWLDGRRHQANNWRNVDFSLMRFWGIHLAAVSQRVPMLLFCIMHLKITFLNILQYLTRSNAQLYCMNSQTFAVRAQGPKATWTM